MSHVQVQLAWQCQAHGPMVVEALVNVVAGSEVQMIRLFMRCEYEARSFADAPPPPPPTENPKP